MVRWTPSPTSPACLEEFSIALSISPKLRSMSALRLGSSATSPVTSLVYLTTL
jgi:hypothetical protein